MHELIESKFISIPNIVADSYLSNDAKLLYGYIRYWDWQHDNRKTLEEISLCIHCSLNTTRKCIKELEQVNFISIQVINKFNKIIKPLVSDGVMIETSKRNIDLNDFGRLSDDEKKEYLEEQAKFKRIKENFIDKL